MRRLGETRRVLPVEVLHREARRRRLAADFVERDEPVEDVEGRVLDALRGDRPGALLELEHEIAAQLFIHRMHVFFRR